MINQFRFFFLKWGCEEISFALSTLKLISRGKPSPKIGANSWNTVYEDVNLFCDWTKNWWYIYVYSVYILFKDIHLISRESQYLVGFVLRRDIQLAIENARSRLDALPGSTLCVFTQHLPVVGSGPPPIKMRKIVDLAPITITDQVILWLICRSK